MNEAIFKKYNVPVPRYTSYPTANRFEEFSAEQYLKAVEASNDATADNISFYIHVPFANICATIVVVTLWRWLNRNALKPTLRHCTKRLTCCFPICAKTAKLVRYIMAEEVRRQCL